MASDSKRKEEKKSSWCKLPVDVLELMFKKLHFTSDYIRFSGSSKSWQLATKPWSELPADILELVFKKLRPISDCIGFSAVCKSWRLASRQTAASSLLQPQLPLLLLPYEPFTDSRSFFSLSTNRIRTLSIPEVRRKAILASSHGWLLLVDMRTEEISLLNPITRSQIQLPPLPTFYGPNNETEARGKSFPSIPPQRGVLSSSPSSVEHDCVVITILFRPWVNYGNDANFCRPGRDEVWTKLKVPPLLDSIVYAKGRFYMLDFVGVVSVYDAAAPSVKMLSLPAPALTCQHFLVKASETELLWCGYTDIFCVEKILRLFKMDLNGRVFEWSEIDSIGDKALFLTREKCSFSMVRARDLPGCKEDCVYYENPIDFWPPIHIVKEIKMKDGSCELIICALEKSSRGLMVSTWFTPSLC